MDTQKSRMESLHEDDIFDAARRISAPEQRNAFLDSACGSDAPLRARVDALLHAEHAADAFFSELEVALGASHDRRRGDTLQPANRPGAQVGEEPIGSKIGRYRLIEKIGEGGCGFVYLAEQEEPVRRRVALKIIKLGMETKSVVARFEAERQALAMMDHPNIARVFDAGATDRGPPYFVMELVRGTRITDYCNQNRFTLDERLALFTKVCHAIQHAHQKGIIHGDVKPSNIMVTLHDGIAVPKVIDFGIAKATEARLSDRAFFTAFTQLVGTPAYMSPEQAEMSGLDIDTRSDIYSLGVLLYELLTGKTPFDGKALLASGLDEFRRTLREKEPQRPSARLLQLSSDELAEVARQRRTEPNRLLAALHGDLDWIVMKALEKDRARRYETANGLAMDVLRRCNHEPVLARPPSRVYRLQKLVRRNRGVFVAAGAVAAALVMGLGASTWLFLREREARQRAVAAEQQQGRLRREAEVREQVTQAALLVSQDRFDEADRRVVGIAFAEPSVEGASVLRSLGEWHVVHGRWKEAAERLALLNRVNSLDVVDATTLDCLRCGPTLIAAEDLAGYERFRRDTVNRFQLANSPYADRIVKISLLLPADRELLTALRPLAEANSRAMTEAENAGDIFQATWRMLSLAFYQYRSGNYAAAIEWCQRCLACPEYNASRTATAHLLHAMALQKSGIAGAKSELVAGRDIVLSKLKAPLDHGTPVQGFWFDWEFARILAREATGLVETSNSPNASG